MDEVIEKPRNYKNVQYSTVTCITEKENQSYGIAIDADGNFVVTDCCAVFPCVKKIDPNGNPIFSLNKKGNGKLEFDEPNGVAINSRGHIHVCDKGNDRIQVIDGHGGFVRQFKIKANWICIDSHDNIFITHMDTDTNAYCIEKYDSGGILLKHLDTLPTKGIQINSHGDILVCGTSNARIEVFDPDLNFLFSTAVKTPGDFHRFLPEEIAIDVYDRLVICDIVNDHLVFFESDLEFISLFGEHGEELHHLKLPQGIVFDHQGRIVVCDFGHFLLKIIDCPR